MPSDCCVVFFCVVRVVRNIFSFSSLCLHINTICVIFSDKLRTIFRIAAAFTENSPIYIYICYKIFCLYSITNRHISNIFAKPNKWMKMFHFFYHLWLLWYKPENDNAILLKHIDTTQWWFGRARICMPVKQCCALKVFLVIISMMIWQTMTETKNTRHTNGAIETSSRVWRTNVFSN